MVKVTTPGLNVGIQHIPLGYMQDNGPNLQPVAQGLGEMASAFMRVQAEQKQKQETMDRYKTLTSFDDFQTQSALNAQAEADKADPSDTTTAQRIIDNQIKYEDEFVKTLPPEMQPEFAYRARETRNKIVLQAHDTQDKLNTKYYENDLQNTQNQGVIDLQKDPDALKRQKELMDQRIDASGLTAEQKYFAKQKNAQVYETAAYGATVKRNKLAVAQYSNDLATSATQAAKELGTTPRDLLAVISYETGGTFNPNIQGGAGGRYRGMIQFGPEEQKKYGIVPGMTVGEQMNAVVRFLKDRGFKPGMTIYDLYSTVNAGSPGHYNARDGHNGGAPGTVADKVRDQFAGHYANADKILGGNYEFADTTDSNPAFSNVLYEDRVALQKDADGYVNQFLAQQAADAKAQHGAMFNDLETGLMDGRYGQADIEKARSDGWLTDYDQIKKVNDIVDQKLKDGANLKTFMDRVTNGYALDPQDPANKEGMNLWYDSTKGEDKLQTMDENYISDVGNMFRATGMIPDKVFKTLGTMTRSADNRKMYYAYKALNALEEMNPDAYAVQINDEGLKNKADVYDVLKYTVPENELYKMLRDNPDSQEARARQERKDAAKAQLNSPDNTTVNFQSVLDSFGADQAEVGTKGQVMEDEWRSLVLWNASQGMSLEQANQTAIKQLQRKWGNTNVDGVTTLARNPIEKFYPKNTSEEITRQVRGELGLQDDEHVQLVSDAKTEADIAAGRPPSYVAMIQDSNGIWVPATGYPDVQSDKKGMIQEGNIDIHNRPMVPNSDGGTSTVDSFSYGTDQGEVLIPRVSDEGKLMDPQEAIAYWQKKGQNLGVFDTPENADAYAQALHNQQDLQYLQGMRTIKRYHFQPSPIDKAHSEAKATVDNLSNQINELEKPFTAGRIKMGAPAAIQQEIADLKARRAVAQQALDGVKEQAVKQYETPAQQALRDAMKQFTPLNNEMQSWTDPIEDWPKAKEWETLYNRVESLKRQVEMEVQKKRAAGGMQ